jgi:hypothetical protein
MSPVVDRLMTEHAALYASLRQLTKSLDAHEMWIYGAYERTEDEGWRPATMPVVHTCRCVEVRFAAGSLLAAIEEGRDQLPVPPDMEEDDA